MKARHYGKGYTLIELMVTVGIIAVLAGIAIPAYNGYISTANKGTIEFNALGLAKAMNRFWYEDDTYMTGTYDPSSGTDDLTGPLDWKPSGDDGNYKYVVAAGPDGIDESYIVTVTLNSDPTVTAVIEVP